MTHSLDYSQSAQFIEALTGDPNTPCTWQTFADKKSIFAKPEVIHGSLVRVWPRLKALQSKGQGIFITVNETDLQGRKDHNITALRACFIDWDSPDEPTKPFPLPYHLRVRSGRGWHYYWLLEPGQPIDEFKATQKALIEWFGSDKSIHDLPRVMRLPGSIHQKSAPLAVEITEAHDLPRYTLAQIRAAYPIPQAARPKRTTPTYSPVDLDSDYAHVLNMTFDTVRSAAGSCAEGSRHSELAKITPIIVGCLKPQDAEAAVLEFCQLTGLPEPEALDLLKWGEQKRSRFTARLPERKLNTRRCKEVTIEGPSKNQIRKDLYEYLAQTIYTPDRRFHLVNVTVGLGKTKQFADVLNELNAQAWPMREDGTPARLLMLVDSHRQAEEFKEKLMFPVEVYKGRGEKNCDEWDTIKKSETPAKFCTSHCPIYKAKQCTYYRDRARVERQRFIIAAKQAYLHEAADLSQFDVIIADEDITAHLYHQNKVFNRDDLHRYKQALELAGLNREQTIEAQAFIDGLLAEMDAPEAKEKVLKRKAPTIDHTNVEKFFSLGKGQYLNPRRLFSLLTDGRYTLRVTTGTDPRLHVTARRELVIENLKQATVINLEATPIHSMLSEFNPVEFTRNHDQNLNYWQDTDYKFTRRMLKQDRFKGIANDRARAIYERTEGDTVVFTFKSDRDDMGRLMPPGTKIGVYGADSKATNQYETCDNFILKGSFTPNVSAMNDLARVAGIKADALIRDRQDAELLQVIGRARGVNRIKPANIFILTNRALKLDKKPRPLNEFFKNTKIRELNGTESSQDAVLHTSPKNSVPNIVPLAMKNCLTTGFEAIKSRVDCFFGNDEPQALKQIRAHVEKCLIDYGFYVHDLAGFGTGSFCTEALAPLAGISQAQYNRYIQQVLNKWESSRVNLDEGQAVKVWGDKQAAIDFVTDKTELAEAVAHVKAEYNRAGGLLNMVFTLGEFEIKSDIKQWLGDRDYTRDNWAILLYRIHKRRQVESLAAV